MRPILYLSGPYSAGNGRYCKSRRWSCDRQRPHRPGVVPRVPRSDLRRPARGMGLVLSAAFADRYQVFECRGAPGAVLPRARLFC